MPIEAVPKNLRLLGEPIPTTKSRSSITVLARRLSASPRTSFANRSFRRSKMFDEWDMVASLRRSQIESGKDLTFSRVFVPLFKKLVNEIRPTSILEAGTGTGHLALELHGSTTRYVGVEPSLGMFSQATQLLDDRDIELINT